MSLHHHQTAGTLRITVLQQRANGSAHHGLHAAPTLLNAAVRLGVGVKRSQAKLLFTAPPWPCPPQWAAAAAGSCGG
eukprot:scaffold45410_cov30-Phaeocystis_antarctica.AAC.2